MASAVWLVVDENWEPEDEEEWDVAMDLGLAVFGLNPMSIMLSQEAVEEKAKEYGKVGTDADKRTRDAWLAYDRQQREAKAKKKKEKAQREMGIDPDSELARSLSVEGEEYQFPED